MQDTNIDDGAVEMSKELVVADANIADESLALGFQADDFPVDPAEGLVCDSCQ